MLLPPAFTFFFSVIMKLLISLFLFYCQSAGILCPLDVAHVRSHLKGSVVFIATNTAWLLLLFSEKENKSTWPVIILLVMICYILSSKMCHFDTRSPLLWKTWFHSWFLFLFYYFLRKRQKQSYDDFRQMMTVIIFGVLVQASAGIAAVSILYPVFC